MLDAIFSFVRARFTPGQRYGLGLTLAFLGVGLAFWGFTETIESWTRQEDFYRLDTAVRQIAQAFATPALTTFFEVLTYAGSLYVVGPIVALLAVVFWRRGERAVVGALLTAFGLGEALLYGLKVFFHRARPSLHLVAAHGYSFPSGHSFTAFVIYGLLIALLWERSVGRGWKVGGTLLLAVLIALVGFSRIYLGVHYFTDVAGGFLLGLGWLIVSITAFRFLRALPTERSGPSTTEGASL